MIHHQSTDQPSWHVIEAVVAWLIPGGGHFMLGERTRAFVLGVSIISLWLGGILIGGLSVCDRQSHPYWFLGQMCVSPTWAAHYYQKGLLKDANPPQTASTSTTASAYEPSFGHMHEQGVLYTALAGLLNLLVIIDVIYREPKPVPKKTILNPPAE